ncbi:MAG: hemerythrin domain-containing protein, partial [Alphaproteobacteria bacterium]
KEDDYLFPVLAKRAPELGTAFDLLRRQHVEGAKRTIDLLEKLEAYKQDPKTGFAAFDKAATEFIEFQREHLAFEESRVLPAARESLTEVDWKAIDAAFAKNDDPIFGDKPQSKFNKLFSRIVSTAPEPWGLKARGERQA